MSELCRLIIVALLLVDIERGIFITSSSSSSRGRGAGGDGVVVRRIREDDDDEGRRGTSTAARRLLACRPATSETLWLRLQHRSTGHVERLDDRRAVRHGRRRRRRPGRGLRRRVLSAANSTSDALDTLRRRRSRRLDDGTLEARSEPSRRRTAWQCGLETFWRRTGPGVFPAYVQTGRCSKPTCMMGLYECRERRYAVGVLRKRRGRCVPLPLTGANSTSSTEELWTPSHVAVVVACECSARRATGVFPHTATSPP